MIVVFHQLTITQYHEVMHDIQVNKCELIMK